MNITQAIEILEQHNKWRRVTSLEMTDPTAFCTALDVVVKYTLRDLNKKWKITYWDVKKGKRKWYKKLAYIDRTCASKQHNILVQKELNKKISGRICFFIEEIKLKNE